MSAATRTTYVGVDLASQSTEYDICSVTAVVEQGEVVFYEVSTLQMAGAHKIAQALCREFRIPIAGVAVGQWMGHSLAHRLSDVAAEDGRTLPVVLLTPERRASGKARAFNLAYQLAKRSSRLFDEMEAL